MTDGSDGGSSASKHTPGPWVARSSVDDPCCVSIDGNDWPRLAQVVVATYEPSDAWPEAYEEGRPPTLEVSADGLANARLIAAAPDLLKALQRILVAFQFYSAMAKEKIADHPVFDDDIEIINAAAAAIAKARGEGGA